MMEPLMQKVMRRSSLSLAGIKIRIVFYISNIVKTDQDSVFAGITNTKRFLLIEVHAEQAEMHLLADEEESRAYIDQTNLTLEEAAAYSSIGTGKLREITNSKNCKFVYG